MAWKIEDQCLEAGCYMRSRHPPRGSECTRTTYWQYPLTRVNILDSRLETLDAKGPEELFLHILYNLPTYLGNCRLPKALVLRHLQLGLAFRVSTKIVLSVLQGLGILWYNLGEVVHWEARAGPRGAFSTSNRLWKEPHLGSSRQDREVTPVNHC